MGGTARVVTSVSVGALDLAMVLLPLDEVAGAPGSALGSADLNRTGRGPGQPERECCMNAAQGQLTCVGRREWLPAGLGWQPGAC